MKKLFLGVLMKKFVGEKELYIFVCEVI